MKRPSGQQAATALPEAEQHLLCPYVHPCEATIIITQSSSNGAALLGSDRDLLFLLHMCAPARTAAASFENVMHPREAPEMDQAVAKYIAWQSGNW